MISERALRNTYFPAFKACVDAGALTLMTSFNDVDGIPSTGNDWLLQDILREEWGFDGMVVTDWNSSGEMIAHGFAEDLKDLCGNINQRGCRYGYDVVGIYPVR